MYISFFTVAIRLLLFVPSLFTRLYKAKVSHGFLHHPCWFFTCGKNILPEPNKSPTTFIPVIRLISITSIGFVAASRASSISKRINSSTLLLRMCQSFLNSPRTPFWTFITFASPFTFSAKSSNLSVSLLFRITSSNSKDLLGFHHKSVYDPIVIPFWIACTKNQCILPNRIISSKREWNIAYSTTNMHEANFSEPILFLWRNRV
jgi:hypothetical protein